MEERRKEDLELRDVTFENRNDIKWMRETFGGQLTRIESKLENAITEQRAQQMIQIAIEPVVRQQKTHISAHRRFVATTWLIIGLAITASIGWIAHEDARAAIATSAVVQPVHNKSTP